MPTGYPTASAFVHANEGQRGEGERDMPHAIYEIDRAVAALRSELRQAVMAGYVWSGPFTSRALRLQLSTSTLRRQLSRAEAQVERILSS